MTPLNSDQPVRHRQHGEGRVVADLGSAVVVRFGVRLEQVERGELEVVRALANALAEGETDDPLALLTRAQALLIRSVNDQWGVFRARGCSYCRISCGFAGSLRRNGRRAGWSLMTWASARPSKPG